MLELEVARAGRQGVPLSVALFEVDRFGEIQKAGGNLAADVALRRVAQVLAESVRLVDTVARYSEDEFVLMAPGPDGLDRRRAAGPERLGARLRSTASSISVSAGVATFPLDGRTPEELLDAAEEAMQSAREAGRRQSGIAAISGGLAARARRYHPRAGLAFGWE